jgi:putative transposase
MGEGLIRLDRRTEEMIRAYIRNQEMADKQLDQLQLKLSPS